MKNWTAIVEAANNAGFIHGYMSAELNASDTINVEKSASPEDHDAIAFASLQSLMAYGNLEKAEHDFFVSIGVEY